VSVYANDGGVGKDSQRENKSEDQRAQETTASKTVRDAMPVVLVLGRVYDQTYIRWTPARDLNKPGGRDSK
jgi:hypothetical protein